MSESYALMKKISDRIYQAEDHRKLLTEICMELNKSIQANVVILDRNGIIIAASFEPAESVILKIKEVPEGRMIETHLSEQIKNIEHVSVNITWTEFYVKNSQKADAFPENIAAVFPVKTKAQCFGTLLLYRMAKPFEEQELWQVEMCRMLITLAMMYSARQMNAETVRRSTIVKSAIGTLSYSELEAVLHIFEELGCEEGFVIASRIADRVGITRSVIVNALRKLESASLIESRSLGMKGTYIKVLNDSFLFELKKLKA